MEKKKQGIVITSVLLVCLILVVIGVSFAFFTYSRQGSKENTITTGSLTFVYDEQKAEGNGITLSNAFPMSDDEGKQLSGSNNVFDFQVLANTQGESIAYEVIGKKDDSSTLPDNVVKIYLTTLSGSEETEVATTIKDGVVTTYDELSDTQIEDQTGKTLYQEVIPLNQSGYQKNFRLRMWLSEEANTTTDGSWDYNNKTFTIRINVVANGEERNTNLIVSEEEPTPYNNLLWVKSNINVNQILISDTMPGAAEEGDVWLKTSANMENQNGYVYFENENQYTIYSAYQYIQGRYISKPTRVYSEDAWHNLTSIIYDQGYYYVSQIVDASWYNVGHVVSYPYFKNENNLIHIYTGTSNTSDIVGKGSLGPIEFDHFTTLHFSMRGGPYKDTSEYHEGCAKLNLSEEPSLQNSFTEVENNIIPGGGKMLCPMSTSTEYQWDISSRNSDVGYFTAASWSTWREKIAGHIYIEKIWLE